MEDKLKHFFKKKKTPFILIAPYFYPRDYGGAVKIYDLLMNSLCDFKPIIITESQNADPNEVSKFDRTVKKQKNYSLIRLPKLVLHFSQNSFLIRLWEMLNYIIKVGKTFRRLLKQTETNIVICGDTLETGWLMSLIPHKFIKINYIHGEELTQNISHGLFRRFLRFFQFNTIKKADMNIVVSSFTKAQVIARTNILPNKIKLLPNFVDLSRFKPIENRKLKRKKLGWNQEIVIITIARLIKRKGIDQVIKALNSIENDYNSVPDWKYFIGGIGPERRNLEKLVQNYGLKDKIIFLDYIPDNSLANFYGAADIFIMANREIEGDTEGFGIVFLEANACGTPVIGGKAGGTLDAIKDGYSGFRVNSNNTREVARALLKLMKDENLRKKMGKQAIGYIKKSYSLLQRVKNFETLIRKLQD